MEFDLHDKTILIVTAVAERAQIVFLSLPSLEAVAEKYLVGARGGAIRS
jgi:hypothetical protein